MARIALIFPPTHAVTVMPPLGLGYVAACARRAGHDVRIYDLARRHLNDAQLHDVLRREKPDYVGLSVMTPNYQTARRTADMLAALPDHPRVVLGGPHVSVYPERSLTEFHADYVCIRESEITFPALIDALENSGDPGAVPGVAYRRDGVTVDTGPAEYIDDLDALPWPAWDLLAPHRYPPIPHQLFVRHLPVAPVLTTRGCPFSCSFCATTWLFGPKIRRRNPADILAEMKHLADRFGIREFHIEDDNPTLIREHIDGLCEALLTSGRRWVWKFPNGVMVKTLDEPLVDLLARAGCYQISLGIETLADNKEIGKSVEIQKVRDIVRWAHQRRVQVQGLFVIGLPNENEATARWSVAQSARLGLDFAHYGNYVPLPGSKWGDDIHRVSADFQNISFYAASGIAPFDAKLAKRLQRYAILRFYFRPRILMNLLRMVKWRQLRGVLYTARRYLFG